MIDDFVAEHVLHHDAINPKPKHESPTSFKQIALLFHTTFPDAHIPLFNLIAEGDRVVARWGLRSTHRGMLKNVHPPQKTGERQGHYHLPFGRSKNVEYWETFDTNWILQQLGTHSVLE